MTQRDWRKGEKVVHAARPEWGTGEVLTAESGVVEGKPCQTLTVRFDRGGLRTVSTAFADLREASGINPAAMEASSDPLLAAATATEVEEMMTKLPEAATDPFSSLRKRLEATLGLYRYGESPRLLLDWAAIQTGLKDPLSRFNRHELEQWYKRFVIETDTHLRKLLREVRKHEPAALDEVVGKAGASGRQAVRRVDALR
jgi:hypothetical protein